MKRLYFAFCIFTIMVLFVPNIEMSAQTVRNSSYSSIGHIDSDGTIRNSSYSTIGHIDSDGTIRNSSYSTIGHIDSDGTIRNSSYSSYSTIGHAKGIKREWAAVWFFFDFF